MRIYNKMRPKLSILLLITGAFSVAGASWANSAHAEQVTPSPAAAWQLTTVAVPSPIRQNVGKLGEYYIAAENIGGLESSGEVTIHDTLPAGLTITRVDAEPETGPNGERFHCQNIATEVSCSTEEPVVPAGFMVLTIAFEVTGTISGANVAAITGGSARTVTEKTEVRVAEKGEVPAPGIQQFRFGTTGVAGEPAAQAGVHPHFLTSSAVFNSQFVEIFTEGALNGKPAKGVQPAKNLVFYLPVGLLGNPTVADRCPASQVEGQNESPGCPESSRVGTILPMILSDVFANSADPTHEYGIYNVVPEKGFAAEFAFYELGYVFTLYANVVRHSGTYMLRVALPGVPAIASPIGFISTFYGDITEPYLAGGEAFNVDRGGFLTDPSNCGESEEAREASMSMNTWEQPNTDFSASINAFPSLEHCERLPFSADLTVEPETTQADAPSGYNLDLEVPQAANSGPDLATPPVKKVSITLPSGTSIAPPAANGLVACNVSGEHGINIEGSESEAVGADGLEQPVPGKCPQASEIGAVAAKTPLLNEELTGHLFIAQPECGPCTMMDAEDGHIFRLYLELQAPERGVIIKLEGDASYSTTTGRLTATFDESPQFPFSRLTVSLNKGPRAPLANPQSCAGVAITEGEVTPWSPSTVVARPSSAFTVTWNNERDTCPASEPFSPAFSAGTVIPVAGMSSPFTLTLKREDREQNISSISTTLPRGLLANVARITKCPEPQASQEISLTACPASSEIGSTSVAVGSGSEPYYVNGKVFFTGPYDGAPFGLAIVVPASAGPFNLGVVTVKVALFVNPVTSQVTAVSSPLPAERDGVPFRIRSINVALTKSDFTLNPTSCVGHKVVAEVSSTAGMVANVANSFATAGCNNLAFDPVLSAKTEAKSTKADGTGVDVKISYPTGGPTEANVAKVVLDFPKKLPVRLTTLKKACLAATFEANPAACPSASAIGRATVHTPVLNQPLEGPAYLVSYGSAKFPDVVFVLQGEGVKLVVDGQSFVSSDGVLKVTFGSVPDAPFSTFETKLSAGEYSQFTSSKNAVQAVADQCGEDLVAPVTMVAQNGLEVRQKPRLQITGCGPSVAVVKVKRVGAALLVTVHTSRRGQLRIAGAGLKTIVKKGASAGDHTVKVALTSRGRQLAHGRRKIRLTVGLVIGKRKVYAHRRTVL